LLAIGLTPLGEECHAVIEQKLVASHKLKHGEHNPFALYASLACAGGHPRLLEQVVKGLEKQRQGGRRAPFTFQGPEMEQLDADLFEFAFTLLSAQLWGREVVFASAPTQLEDERLKRLQDDGHATESCLPDETVAFRVVPWTVLNFGSESFESSRLAILGMFRDPNFDESWEKGLAACLHLKAQSVYYLQRLRKGTSSLPGYHHRSLDLPFTVNEVPTLALMVEGSDKKEWPKLKLSDLTFDEINEHAARFEVAQITDPVTLDDALKNGNALVVSSLINQPAFEGFFVCSSASGPIPIFFQNKLHQKVHPSDIKKRAADVHTYARDHFKRKPETYYALIFCTRDIAKSDLDHVPEGTIVVTRQGCEALLRPFHASRLVELIGEEAATPKPKAPAVKGVTTPKGPPRTRAPKSKSATPAKAAASAKTPAKARVAQAPKSVGKAAATPKPKAPAAESKTAAAGAATAALKSKSATKAPAKQSRSKAASRTKCAGKKRGRRELSVAAPRRGPGWKLA